MTEEAARYDALYRQESYYWGVAPSAMVLRVIELLPPVRPLRVLDLGCGEGKDAVFFARCGYDVTAVDLAPAGLDKLRRLAERAGVRVRAVQADVNEFHPDGPFDVVYSSGALHYIKAENHASILAGYKDCVNPGGLAALQVFVRKPFLAPPPEREQTDPWRSGELLGHFCDWRVEHCDEYIFDCDSSGVPHQHATNHVFARKPE